MTSDEQLAICEAGELLYEFTALYTLTYEEKTCRIVALAHDEVARSR